ncbi:phage holin family protein [Runella sp.]|uniref:phage holin family protein n=1 Tax=Runella sp. TaxID=1960881 RepID=UPI003D0B2E7B
MKKLFDFFEYFASKPMILASTLLISWLKAVFDLVEIHLFNDWDVLIALLILVHLDTFLGFWNAVKTKQVSSRGFSKYFEKLVLYFSALIVIHVLYNLPSMAGAQVVLGWFKASAQSLIVVREGISVLELVGAIRPGLINPNILSYLKKFDTSGKLSDLQNPNP